MTNRSQRMQDSMMMVKDTTLELETAFNNGSSHDVLFEKVCDLEDYINDFKLDLRPRKAINVQAYNEMFNK